MAHLGEASEGDGVRLEIPNGFIHVGCLVGIDCRKGILESAVAIPKYLPTITWRNGIDSNSVFSAFRGQSLGDTGNCRF